MKTGLQITGDVDGSGTIFEEVEAEEFSTSCGCFTITEEPTTIMPTEAGTHGDTPAPSEDVSMTSSMTEEPATPIPTEAGTHEGDTPAPMAGSRGISSMTNESTVSLSPSPSHMIHTSTSPTVAPSHGPQVLYPTHAPTQTTHNPSFTSVLTPTSTPTYTPTSFTHSPASVTMSPTSAVEHPPSSSISSVGATPVPSHGDRGIDSSMAPSGGPTLGGFDPANTGSTMFPKLSVVGTVGACIVVVLVGSVIHVVS